MDKLLIEIYVLCTIGIITVMIIIAGFTKLRRKISVYKTIRFIFSGTVAIGAIHVAMQLQSQLSIMTATVWIAVSIVLLIDQQKG